MNPVDYIKNVKLKCLLDTVRDKHTKHFRCTNAEYDMGSSSLYNRYEAINYINQVFFFSAINVDKITSKGEIILHFLNF